MKRLLRHTARWLGWALLGLVGLVCLALILVQTPPAKNFIRKEAVSQVNALLEGEVEVGRLSGSLLGSLTLHNVRIVDGRDRPLATIDRVFVDYSIRSLAGDHIEVDSITLGGPRVLISRYEDGTLNVSTLVAPAPVEETEEPLALKLSVSSIELNRGLVAWRGAGPGDAAADLPDMASLITPAPREELEARARQVAEAIESRGDPGIDGIPPVALARELTARGRFAMDGAADIRAAVDRLETIISVPTLESSEPLDIEGFQGQITEQGAEAKLRRLSFSDADILRGVTAGLAFARDEAGEAQYWGRIKRLHAPKSLLGAVAPSIEARSDVTAELEVGGTEDDMSVDAGFRFDPGRLSVSGRIGLPSSGEATWRGAVDGRDLELSALTALAPDAGGDIEAWFDGRGTTFETLEGRADIAISDAHYDRWRFDRVLLKAAADEQRITAQKIAVDSPYADATAMATYGRDGNVSAAVRARTSEGVEVRRQTSGRGEATVTLRGRLDPDAAPGLSAIRRLNLAANWDIGAFSAPAVTVNHTTGNVALGLSPLAGTSKMRARADIDASVRGLVVGPHLLQRADVDISGTTRMPWPPTLRLGLLEQSELQGDVLVSGLETGDDSLASADFSMSIAPTKADSEDDANIELSGGIEGLDAAGVQVSSAQLDLTGSTGLTGITRGVVNSLELSGEADWNSLEAPGISNAGGQMTLDIAGFPSEPTGTIEVAGGETTAAGVDWKTISAALELSSENRFAVDSVLSPAETPKLPYRIEAEGIHSDDFMAYDLRSLTLARGSETWTLREEAEFQLRDGIGFDSFALVNGRQVIALDGIYRTDGPNSLSVDITDLDLGGVARLGGLFGVPELSGRLTAQLELQGTSRRPDIRLTSSVKRGVFKEWGPADIELSAQYADHTLEISNLQVQIGDQRIIDLSSRVPMDATLDGQFELLWKREATVDLRVPQLDLGEVIGAIGLQSVEALDGTAEGHLQVSGPMVRPDVSGNIDLTNLTFQGSVAGTTFDIHDFGFESSVDVSSRESEHDITFDVDANWRDEAVFRASLDTSAPLQSWLTDFYGGRTEVNWFERVATLPFSMDLVMQPLQLSEMPISALAEADAEGIVEGYVSIDGTLRNPDASFDLNVDDFGWNIYRDIYVDLKGSVRDDVLKLSNLRVEWDADEILVARGTMPFPTDALLENETIEDHPVDFALELKPTAFQKLGAIDYTFTRFQGTLAGYLTVGGSLRDPHIRTRLALTNTNLNRTADSTLGIEVIARDDRVKADAFVCKENRRILTAGAQFPINLDPVALADGASLFPPGDVSARISGQNVSLADVMPAPLLKGTLEDIEGTLSTDLRVAGDWMELHPSGSLTIEDGAVTLVDYGRRLRNLTLKTEISAEQIKVHSLSMEGASGSVSATGTASLTGLIPTEIDADLQTDSFDISGFGTDMTALVTTQASLTGIIDPPTYTIDVSTEELEIELPASQTASNHPLKLTSDIIVTDPRRGGQQAGDVSPYLAESTGEVERTHLQVQVDLSRQSWLRHPSGDLNFTGSFGIDIFGESVVMDGSLDSIRGDFEFLGTGFTVPNKEAIVRFRGADPPNPALSIEAHHPLDRSIVAEVGQPASGDAQIVVRVTGYALEPRLVLSSDPGMSETDILFVLMTGRPPSNAGVGQDESVANQAVAAASGIFSGLLQQRLSGTLPVDMLRIETGDQGFQDSRIKVGKYITDDIFVSYSYQFGSGDEDSGYQARIEYHFLPRWMFEAVYGAHNTGELNVFWDIY